MNIPTTLYAQWAPIDFYENGSTYTINTAEGWDQFCDALQDNDTYNRFSGKTVKLGADISVIRMAGSSGHDFMGTFDGQGHTLTVNYNTSEQYAAPFRNVENGCVIENLIVAGTITTSAMNAAGIAGNQYGTVRIRNCRSSVTIQSSVNGDGTRGGFVGNKGNSNSAGLYIEGCVFDGKIVSTGTNATTDCGGFVGWTGDNGLLNITNCLYAPTADPNAVSVGATFARNWLVPDESNYYTTTLGTAQGKAARSITANDNSTTVAFAGFPAATYSVSGITAYSVGLVYGGTLYGGLGDQVNLTVSSTAFTPEPGYQYAFTASAGTVNGTTLTMPDQDVTLTIDIENRFPVDWATVNRGTQNDPYMISNTYQLLLLAHRVNGTHGETSSNDYHGKYFKLGADIAFPYEDEEYEESEEDYENYEAIGGYHDSRTCDFRGDFRGDNKTVSGIRIRKTGQNLDACNQGLFGSIGAGANIHDIHLTNALITGLNVIGGIVGVITHNTAIVSGCSVTESEFTMRVPIGGGVICGRNDGNGTLSNNNNYYCTLSIFDETVTDNIGCNGGDITDNQGAMSAYYLDLGDGVTILTPMAADLGFSYDSNDDEDENYWRQGAELTLGFIGNVPEGYALQYSTTAGTINGSTLSVSGDASVRANFIEIIPYIDADGNTAYCSDYTTLTEDYLTSRNDVNLIAGAWYVVKITFMSPFFPTISPSAAAAQPISSSATARNSILGALLMVTLLVHTDSDGEQLTIAPDGIAANGKKSLPPLPKGMQLSGLDDEDDEDDEADGDDRTNRTNTANSSFAYCDGRQLVITQPGRLEAFDALGRRLFVRELDSFPNSLPATLFPSTGVYLLRLDNKTQKIVIR